MRVEGKGLIDGGISVPFSFDGRRYCGRAGDTLASALLANDVLLVGRSFKYHRPRGIMTAGAEEPNGLVTLLRGKGRVPNMRATTQELYEGLEASRQNAWPSLRLDLLALNDLAAPFLSAGFYYKTFMWPRSFWQRLYEPVIRRAAGLGALPKVADDTVCEKMFAHCDVLVIGAGPAGLMAAKTAAQSGADVILAESDRQCGGRLLAETEEVDGRPGCDWASDLEAELRGMGNVRLMPRTTVTGTYDQGTYSALEKVAHHLGEIPDDVPFERFWRIHARQAVLCAGALERPVAFANNDRPGVMMAGAVRAYLNRWGAVAGRKVAVFGNNDGAARTAADLLAAGIEVTALIDSRADAAPGVDCPTFTGAQVCDTKGRMGLDSITIRTASGTQRVEANCLAVSGGWNPTIHLASHLNGRPVWDERISAFVPGSNPAPGLFVAGAADGEMTTSACLRSGIEAAKKALEASGTKPVRLLPPAAEDGAYSVQSLWVVDGAGRKWLDFQNDVTVKDVELSARENLASSEHMKRYTTLGMAPDQGKNSNVNALAVLAKATGRDISETGTTTFRPPYEPVSIAAMGAGGRGAGFAPERFSTTHEICMERGAPMVEAGLWFRPLFFPKPGEKTWRQSCDREVNMVRQCVGITDVSTLGKIDVQGPDAAAFLDFIYANRMSSLKVGRVRYGLMLREDGHVMDDGTCARFAARHFVITTTTAAAAQVLQHLEFVQQCLCPEMNVRFASVTEDWAQFAVAGPKAQALVNQVLDRAISSEAFPFMACGQVTTGAVSGRLFRISFSGEHAYEIAVPARFGAAIFQDLLAKAEAMGGGAYGMEALNVLRIEKGFLTHAEIDGRVTPFDLGMEKLLTVRRDFIGKAAAKRPGLNGREREQLVGLRPVGTVRQLTAGAYLFAPGNLAVAENAQGHTTSACYSPTLGSSLALGFLRNGRARQGAFIRVVDHVRKIETLCEVCDPVFFDPDGGRARD